jgi:hypothetical protein
MYLPDWMIEEHSINEKVIAVKKGRRSNFLTKTIRDMRAVICEDLQTEQYAKRDGLLQQVNSGCKLVAMIVLILGANLSRQIRFTGILAIYPLADEIIRFNLFRYAKTHLEFIPLITLIFSLPVTLNIFMNGTLC